jgi:hypothetical protein
MLARKQQGGPATRRQLERLQDRREALDGRKGIQLGRAVLRDGPVRERQAESEGSERTARFERWDLDARINLRPAGACYLEEPIKKGVTYPCVIETSAYCVGNEKTRYPVARLLINRGRGFKVAGSARSSPMSVDCRFWVGPDFGIHYEFSAVEGSAVARRSARGLSG